MNVIATLYKFTELKDASYLRPRLYELMKNNDIKGTVILAPEGINGTIAGTIEAIEVWKAFFLADQRFLGWEYKEFYSDFIPFKRIKIHLKKEIVTLGRPDIDPRLGAGDYVDGKAWNQLIKDPLVTVLDVRNDFEAVMGGFLNATNPQTKSFRDFVAFVENNLSPAQNKTIAMSCTGGVRCEKASALMKKMGYEKVFHLKGGILQYLKDMPQEESLWRGQCFVFDDRIAVDQDLNPVAKN